MNERIEVRTQAELDACIEAGNAEVLGADLTAKTVTLRLSTMPRTVRIGDKWVACPPPLRTRWPAKEFHADPVRERSPELDYGVSLAFNGAAKRFVACAVRLKDIAIHPDGDYPEKCKGRACRNLYEVDVYGRKISTTPAA